MRTLLIVSALLEASAGLLLVFLPSVIAAFLFGSRVDTAVALAVARTAGVALVTLAVACWGAHRDANGKAARVVVGAMAIYNAGMLVVLVHAGTVLGLSARGLWPAVIVHAAMAAWCVKALGGGASTGTNPASG